MNLSIGETGGVVFFDSKKVFKLPEITDKDININSEDLTADPSSNANIIDLFKR